MSIRAYLLVARDVARAIRRVGLRGLDRELDEMLAEETTELERKMVGAPRVRVRDGKVEVES